VACGAALQVVDAQTLMREAQRLLGDPQAMARMSNAALEFTRKHRGATARTLKLLHFK
jgi:3-deoxy-D-manno-octulosonic-acid transferase